MYSVDYGFIDWYIKNAIVADKNSLRTVVPEKNVCRRRRTRERKVGTGVKRFRLDRFGHRCHVGMWRVRVGWNCGQISRGPGGCVVFYRGCNRVFIVRYTG